MRFGYVHHIPEEVGKEEIGGEMRMRIVGSFYVRKKGEEKVWKGAK